MTSSSPRRLAAATLIVILVSAAVCAAQDEPGQAAPDAPSPPAATPAPAPPPDPLKLTIDSGFQYVFETGIEDGGDVSIGRLPLVIDAETPISKTLGFTTSFRYELGLYDFSGISALGPDPWDDVNTLTLAGRVEWKINRQWRIWGGPFVGWAWEAGAGLTGDALTAGGLFGFTYIVNERLVLGGGAGVSSKIEDNVLVYPIIILNWQITDDLSLSSRAGPRGIGAAGLELVYNLGKGWEIGAGGRYELRRFRLDGTGIADNGVGEETNFPFWGRATYRFHESFKLDFYAGVAMGGNLRLEDAGGRRLADADYDPALTIGLFGSLQF